MNDANKQNMHHACQFICHRYVFDVGGDALNLVALYCAEMRKSTYHQHIYFKTYTPHKHEFLLLTTFIYMFSGKTDTYIVHENINMKYTKWYNIPLPTV